MLNVHIYVTPICNIRCKHCYYDAGIAVKKEQLLTIEQLKSIVTELYTVYNANFHIEGGELFLRDDINELFENLSEHVLKKITITTNGTIDLSRHTNYLRKINCLRVSVCGHTDEMQRELRDIDLTKVLKTIQYAKKEKIPVKLRMTLNKKYYKELLTESIQYYYEKEGIKEFSLYEFQPVGRGKEVENVYVMDEEDCKVIFQLIGNIQYEDIGIGISLSNRRRTIVEKYQKELEAYNYEVLYLSPEESLTINYNGDIGICPWNIGKRILGRYKGKVGTIIQDLNLQHSCDYCSTIVIQKKNKGFD